MNSAPSYAASDVVAQRRPFPENGLNAAVAPHTPLFQQLREQQDVLHKLLGDCVELAAQLEANLTGPLPPPGHDLPVPSALKAENPGGLQQQLGALFRASEKAALVREVLHRTLNQL